MDLLPLDQLGVHETSAGVVTFGGVRAVDRLPYLADLGINCIEVMPVSNAGPRVDWGFMPMGYFGVDERYGTRSDMHRFVQEAHAHGIAVIIDSVYDEIGHRLLRVVRLCLRIRRERAEVRGDEFHFYDDWWGHQRRGVLVFSRGRGAAMTVVALNFTDDHVGVPFTFPEAGRWRNGLDQEEIVTAPNEPRSLVIPSNYGQVWTLVEG